MKKKLSSLKIPKDLNKIISDWLLWIKTEKRLAVNTSHAYKRDFDLFMRFLIEFHNENISLEILKKIDDQTIRSWFYYRLKKNITKPRSNARALSSIKSFFSFLKKNYLIDSSRILKIRSPKFQEGLPRPLSISEIEKIIFSQNCIKKEWIKRRNIGIFLLLWGYGLRISEALNLKIKDFDSDEYIIITGKGNKQRFLPILKEIKEYILKILNFMPFKLERNSFIFLGVKGGKLNPRIIQREMKKLRLNMFLPETTTPHSLRHSFATQLLHNDTDLRTIQELLGHESLSSTQKYTAIDLRKIKKTINDFHPRSKK